MSAYAQWDMNAYMEKETVSDHSHGAAGSSSEWDGVTPGHERESPGKGPPPLASPASRKYYPVARAILGDPDESPDIRLRFYPTRRIAQEMRRQVADTVLRRILRQESVRMIIEFQWLLEDTSESRAARK